MCAAWGEFDREQKRAQRDARQLRREVAHAHRSNVKSLAQALHQARPVVTLTRLDGFEEEVREEALESALTLDLRSLRFHVCHFKRIPSFLKEPVAGRETPNLESLLFVCCDLISLAGLENARFAINLVSLVAEGGYLGHDGTADGLDALRAMPHLSELRLGGNRLAVLPRDLGDTLPRLRTLMLHCNYLTELPRSMSRLSNLTTLSLSANNLAAVPPWIGAMRSLTALSIGSSLGGNPIATLPPSLCVLKNLALLDLTLLPLRMGRYVQPFRYKGDLAGMAARGVGAYHVALGEVADFFAVMHVLA